MGRVGKVQGASECRGLELQAKNKKINNFPVAVKIRTSGYQTLECFNASLDPNLGLNPSLTVLSQICRFWPVNCTEVRLADGLHPDSLGG